MVDFGGMPESGAYWLTSGECLKVEHTVVHVL